MRLSLIKNTQIYDIILPDTVEGSYWISDEDSNGIRKNIISIEAVDNKWEIISNKEYYCVENNIIQETQELFPFRFYQIENKNDKTRNILYCAPVKVDYNYYKVTGLLEKGIYIGGGKKDTIYYQPLENNCAYVVLENNKLYILDNGSKYGVYVNKVRVIGKKELKLGDIVFIMGLQFYLIKMYENNMESFYLAVNTSNSNNIAVMNVPSINLVYKNDEFEESNEEIDIPLYEEKDYFYRNPRFINHLKKVEVKIDAPPAKQETQDQSTLLTVGPMITMSMTSLVTGFTSINNLTSGKTSLNQAMPSLIMCGAMLASTFVWPVFSNRYQKHQVKKQEKKRQKKYGAYIDQKRNLIIDTKRKQGEILNNSFPNTKYCEEVILNRYTNLWQKKIEDEDYLKINLGTGDYPAAIEIKFPEESFSLEEDNLKELLAKVGNEPRILSGVPIVLSLLNDYKCGIIGEPEITGEYFRRMLIQILAFHSYEDLKIVVLTDENNEYQWKFLKDAPHCFSDDRSIRFFATKNDEYKEVCYYLERIFQARKDEKTGSPKVPVQGLDKIYLVITDSFKKVRDFDILDDILDSKENFGFSLVVLDKKIINLPEQCKTIISINKNLGELKNIDNFIEGIKFTADFSGDINFDDCTKKLANIPIDIDSTDEGQLPNKIGFLEMYDVGKVEQLNSLSRWKNNNPILNLQVPVGVGKNGESINIDLHEKYHGPHGLIAGMTGSGKSEFIITYILSMAVNYHPYEVQFILIDYKGGGLAGAFENKKTGLKLPHLVGTITNLDANEINRSLASIESELKRRQAIFNRAREISGESTVDIYKYQKMYRNGQIDEPVSHLFIISDEFAELKNQQPEFMDQLISTARIGRSLGVHLILATQKPSGVVDAQIWSNTRFRVCMRVQEKSDSNEVIKCPDAAFLKQTGRFYFQVGYNEIFVLGQAAYAGGKYFPEEKVKKNIDTSIQFINNISYVIKQTDTKVKQLEVKPQGEELSNIVKYLDSLAKAQNIKCRPLWLEKIGADIRVDDLIEKYHYQKEYFVINPVVGEYDIPSQQEQMLLTLPISQQGNSLIFGSPGSGKENFITTLIYSSMISYLPTEINYYIIDFGSGTLKSFRKSPIVGDVIDSNDEEKVVNLYKMIDKLINERRELFSEYNGDYYNYCKNSGKTVPTIVVVINNYESYQETYSDYDDTLVTLSREGSKYGIYFVITVNTPNGMRFKLKQNFATTYCLQQNNEDDYLTILGNVHKKYPAKIFGRGIFKEGNSVYEFQTANVTDLDSISNFIKEKCNEYADKSSVKAVNVPMLPKVVTEKDIISSIPNKHVLAIGIDKDTLDISVLNFKKNFVTLVSALDINQTIPLINPLINQILAKGDYDLKVINCEECLVDVSSRDKYDYVDNDFDTVFTKMYNYITEKKQEYEQSSFDKKVLANEKQSCCIILGIESFKGRLSSENKSKLSELFTLSKELEIVNFIIVDNINNIKKNEFESWYKECVDNTTGIWVGNGLSDQFTLKVNVRIDEMKKDVPEGFCFVINKGRPKFVKYVSKYMLDNTSEAIETIDEL